MSWSGRFHISVLMHNGDNVVSPRTRTQTSCMTNGSRVRVGDARRDGSISLLW
jgi:hypothetical protein